MATDPSEEKMTGTETAAPALLSKKRGKDMANEAASGIAKKAKASKPGPKVKKPSGKMATKSLQVKKGVRSIPTRRSERIRNQRPA